MRKRQKNQPVEEALDGELITGRREYVLLKPITQAGERKEPPAKVKLNDRQAEWLKGSGHI